MKAAVYYENGAPQVFRYEDVADPVCDANSIVIDVKAVSIEGGDVLNRAGGALVTTPVFFVEQGMKDDPRPLHVAFLGPLTDMASALLIEPQLKGRHFPEDGSGPVDVEVLGASLAAAGDRLLIALRVNWLQAWPMSRAAVVPTSCRIEKLRCARW